MLSFLVSLFVLFITALSVPFDSQTFSSSSFANSGNTYESVAFYVDATKSTTVRAAILDDSPLPDTRKVSPSSPPRCPCGSTIVQESPPIYVCDSCFQATLPHGPFLGRIGTETPKFRAKCRKCCRKTKRRLSGQLHFLKGCKKCKLKKNLPPPPGCPEGTHLGFAKNPDSCFRKRCDQMLARKHVNCRCFLASNNSF